MSKIDKNVKILRESDKILDKIRKETESYQTKQKPNFAAKFKIAKINYENKIKEAENEYNEKLTKLIMDACVSDDYKSTFEFLQLIHKEGNTATKSQVKYNIGKRLFSGFGCKQNISMGLELIKEASDLGNSSATAWITQHKTKHYDIDR
ncbi:hypothetical protein C2G38_2046328 [Gigaspora rosea]|uniref:Sel1 repeat family protein n=1 Tax=Gigaspora rosea TaxID=44941 RepID=A0A397U9S7_9GLOM|nr:hypothetical protein C2G38_2046328 [Gigaspora rosea]